MAVMFAMVASAIRLMADFAKFLEVFNDLYRGNQELERYLHEIGLALRFLRPVVMRLDQCQVPEDLIDLFKQDLDRGITLLEEVSRVSFGCS